MSRGKEELRKSYTCYPRVQRWHSFSDAKKFKTGIIVPLVTEKCVVANVLESGRFYYYWHDYFAYIYIYIYIY